MITIKTILERNISEKLYNKIKLFFDLLEGNGECIELYFIDYNDKGEYLIFSPYGLPRISLAFEEDETFEEIVKKADFILNKIEHMRNEKEKMINNKLEKYFRGKNEKT